MSLAGPRHRISSSDGMYTTEQSRGGWIYAEKSSSHDRTLVQLQRKGDGESGSRLVSSRPAKHLYPRNTIQTVSLTTLSGWIVFRGQTCLAGVEETSCNPLYYPGYTVCVRQFVDCVSSPIFTVLPLGNPDFGDCATGSVGADPDYHVLCEYPIVAPRGTACDSSGTCTIENPIVGIVPATYYLELIGICIPHAPVYMRTELHQFTLTFTLAGIGATIDPYSTTAEQCIALLNSSCQVFLNSAAERNQNTLYPK
ncbi:hypothetical protein Bbelb_035990 [Branchiostoma belcheri]|nr:hypothetical protein Bbelb_035990 [Branchiostoma belcheri]